MQKLLFITAILAISSTAPAQVTDRAPALQWVSTAGGSGNNSVGAAAADPQGNLYIVGATASPTQASTTDALVLKLDPNGNILYSTSFGGSGNDAATALAIGPDGSLYVTGTTNSADLPITAGAYLSTRPSTHAGAASFVLKLNPSGSVDWATYFTETTVASIAVDSAGNPFIGGSTGGGLPTTPGVYNTTFQQNVGSNGFFAVIGPLSAFVTKFNAKGTALIYSTYVPTDNQKNIVDGAQALLIDAAGNAWIGVPSNPSTSPGTRASIVKLNPTGSAVLASAVQPGLGSVAALALDASSNVYVAGSRASQGLPFPATPGAFEPAPQPAIPPFSNQAVSGGGLDAFVAKWDSSLSNLLAATLLGGELLDTATSIAVDSSGIVIVAGYTTSKAFPTHAPFQEAFSPQSGFVAGFDSNLTNLLFSTYLGDGRLFAARAAVPDGNGNILVAGSTLNPGSAFTDAAGNLIVANKIALPPAPVLRLDSVQNYASHVAGPLAPGEPIIALGAGFGTGAQMVVDGAALATVSSTASSIVAVLPDTTATSGFHTLQISNNGVLSNVVYAPAAPASPAIYSVDSSGEGQGYILNSDGTLNSPSNPAATGSTITIFIAGQGQYTLNNGYAVTTQTPVVLIEGFYCNGIAAIIGPVDGLPGNVYQLSVFVPDLTTLVKNNPDLKTFKFPAQSIIRLIMTPQNATTLANSPISQNGIFINIK